MYNFPNRRGKSTRIVPTNDQRLSLTQPLKRSGCPCFFMPKMLIQVQSSRITPMSRFPSWRSSPAVTLPLSTYEYRTKLRDFMTISCSLLIPLTPWKPVVYMYIFYSISRKMVLLNCCISIYYKLSKLHPKISKINVSFNSPVIRKRRWKSVCLSIRNLMRESQFNELNFAEWCEVESHFYLYLC